MTSTTRAGWTWPGRMVMSFLLLATCAQAQQQGLGPPPPPPAPAMAPATVSYSVESENRDPRRFSLSIDLLGHATYTADEPASSDLGEQAAEGTGAAQPYRVQFDVSPAIRDRVFALTQALEHFHGDFEFRKHSIADTGRKTFRYSDFQGEGETVFHWSENKQMQALTELFESVALTQNFGRRLLYLRRYDRLGLDATLKRMEELAKGNYLSELQAIAPVLRQVAGDASVMHVARERANRLLGLIAEAPAAASSPR